MRQAAFTLLETLLAITLTASVGIAAVSLTTMQARVGVAARTQEEALACITETVRLLDDDLLLSVKQARYGRFEILEHGDLRLVTSCCLPGDLPDLREVVWHFDAPSGTLFRTSTPLHGGVVMTRPVGRDWKIFLIELDHDTLLLTGRVGASEQIWRVPLWSESP
ncbi:MAG: type II secretion system protein [Planctomycetota bacterium]|mgnify:CR=1 FL=1